MQHRVLGSIGVRWKEGDSIRNGGQGSLSEEVAFGLRPES